MQSDPETEAVEWGAAPAVASDAEVCARCGHPLRPGALFCTNCGAAQRTEPAEPTAPAQPVTALPSAAAPTRPQWWLIPAAVAVVVVLALLFLVARSRTGPTAQPSQQTAASSPVDRYLKRFDQRVLLPQQRADGKIGSAIRAVNRSDYASAISDFNDAVSLSIAASSTIGGLSAPASYSKEQADYVRALRNQRAAALSFRTWVLGNDVTKFEAAVAEQQQSLQWLRAAARDRPGR